MGGRVFVRVHFTQGAQGSRGGQVIVRRVYAKWRQGAKKKLKNFIRI